MDAINVSQLPENSVTIVYKNNEGKTHAGSVLLNNIVPKLNRESFYDLYQSMDRTIFPFKEII